jgi:hypothetical protein
MDAAALRALPKPPEGASPPLTALWHVAQGEWEKAHVLVQAEETIAAAWVHAHLHRLEGDLDNAGYWYGQAGKKLVGLEPDDEWKEIAGALLLEGGW